MKKILIGFALLLSLSGANVFAQSVPTPGGIAAPYTCTTNYYVAKNGSDSNDGTANNAGHAWLTIGHAKAAMLAIGTTLPNTCVNVAAGTYNESQAGGSPYTDASGDTTGYLTYRSITPQGAIITIPQSLFHGFYAGFKFENANYIGIDGFTIQGDANVYSFTTTGTPTATVGTTYTSNGYTWTVVSLVGSTLTMTSPGGLAIPQNSIYSGGLFRNTLSTTTILNKSGGAGGDSPSISVTDYLTANDTGITNSGNVSGSGAVSLDSHFVIINNFISNTGAGGIGFNHSDYLIIEGNQITNTSRTITDFNVQTSGISTYQQVAAYTISGTSMTATAAATYTNSGKTCTATQTVSGATTLIVFCYGGAGEIANSGTLTKVGGGTNIAYTSVAVSTGFHTIIQSNVLTGNKTIINANSHSDGNAIIIDDCRNTQSSSPYLAYAKTTQVIGNLAYTNGGGAVHVFLSDLVTAANNTSYNNYTDLADTSNPRGDINFSSASNCTAANNIAWAVLGGGSTANNSAYADFSFAAKNTGNTWYSNISYNGINGQSSVRFTTSQTTAVYSTATPYFNLSGQDPVFISLATNNFVISVASPAATFGNATYAPTVDLNGTSVSNPPMMGAYVPTGTPPPSLIKGTIM